MAYWIKDMSCCNECCNPCKKKDKIEIKAWECISIDKSEEWVYTINNEASTTIESTNGTVNVRLKPGSTECKKEYDLSVACEDKKVGVCSTDTPWYLWDKIAVSWCLTKDVLCPWSWTDWNGVVTLWIDTECLQNQLQDEKVAVEEWCTAWYLNDVVVADNSYIDTRVEWCKLYLVDKESNIKPLLKVRLRDTVVGTQPAGSSFQTDWDYVLCKDGAMSSPKALASTYNLEIGIGASEDGVNGFDENGFLIVPMDWYYRISYGGTCEFDSWVHARRTYLYHVGSFYDTPICLESRGAGVTWVPKSGTDFPIYMHGVPDPQWYSYGSQIERASFAWTTIEPCRKGDRFAIGIKISSTITDPNYDYSVDAHFQIQGSNTQSTWGADRGAYYTLEWIRPL